MKESTTRFTNNNMVGEEFWRKSDVQSVREACAVQRDIEEK